MSRRQKGPTPEELIEKLKENFEEYKTLNDEKVSQITSENESLKSLVEDFQKAVGEQDEAVKSQQAEQEKRNIETKEAERRLSFISTTSRLLLNKIECCLYSIATFM